MEKSKKIKIIVGLFYLIAVSSFLIYFFSKFTFDEITSYKFIQDNREYFVDLKNQNLILLIFIFFFSTILWVFAAGFGSPVALFAGFIFGKWFGTMLVAISLASGATVLYIFGNYFFKDLIKKKFLNKFHNLEEKFKKSEFNYLLIYRFIGGIPFAISNLIPCIFNVSKKNFFFATLIGTAPQLFLVVSLGSGLEKIIEQNLSTPKISDILFSPEIYIPIIAFFLLIIISIFIKRIFYRD